MRYGRYYISIKLLYLYIYIEILYLLLYFYSIIIFLLGGISIIYYIYINLFGGIIFLSREITLHYLTIRHAQTVGVSDLSCLEHTELTTSVTEIV